jgi:CRP/FNR family transcriptional regulator, cyclic AMP receptor protein
MTPIDSGYDVVAALARTHAFHAVPEADLQKVADMVELEAYEAGQPVFQIGEHDADLHLVLEGELRVQDEDGNKITDLGAGATVGEVALLDSQPRSATVIAKTRVVLAVIPALQLWKMIESQPVFGKTVLFNLGRVLAARLRSATGR